MTQSAIPELPAGAATLLAASRDGRVLKGHGTGNDFVVVIDLDDDLVLTPAMVAALCDRHQGVGGDGVIRIGGPPAAEVVGGRDLSDAAVFMDYHNADGTIGEMCGNGVRVVARLVVDRDLAPAPAGRLEVATRAGMRPVAVSLGRPGRVAAVTVDMGPPEATAAAIGLDTTDLDGDVASFHLDGPDVPAAVAAMAFTGMSMGNPHAVALVDDVDAVDVATVGRTVETHRRFAAGANVNFAQRVDRANLRLRVWERGVGETLACGSGACASVAAMAAMGLVDDTAPVLVHVPGGTLSIVADDDGHLRMTGPAQVVATVELDAAWVGAHLGEAT